MTGNTIPIATHPCKVCQKPFPQFRSTQTVCSIKCAAKLPRLARKAAAADRRQTRAQLEAMKSLAQLRKEAQASFNAFIRARDKAAGFGCICCGAPLDWNSGKPGGSVDAGHFVSRGSAIELAFDERNVNAQRKSCNRPGGTTRDAFRDGMLARYGAAVVAELEGPHDLPKLKHDDLRRIRDEYRVKAKAAANVPALEPIAARSEAMQRAAA